MLCYSENTIVWKKGSSCNTNTLQILDNVRQMGVKKK